MNIDLTSVIDFFKTNLTASLIFSFVTNVYQFMRGRSDRAKIRRLEGLDIHKRLEILRLERDGFQRKHAVELEELKGSEYSRVKYRLEALEEKQQREMKKNQLEIEYLERMKAEKELKN